MLNFIKVEMIIGISGKIGSGKDTVKDILTRQLLKRNFTVEHASFAKKLREVVAAMTGVSFEFLCSHEGKNTLDPTTGLTYGQLLQVIGQNFRNTFGSDIWVKLAFNESMQSDFIIFSDVRYVEEYDKILSMGGHVLRLEGDPHNVRVNSSRDLNHSSETALDHIKFDFVIENTGTLKDLESMSVYYLANIFNIR